MGAVSQMLDSRVLSEHREPLTSFRSCMWSPKLDPTYCGAKKKRRGGGEAVNSHGDHTKCSPVQWVHDIIVHCTSVGILYTYSVVCCVHPIYETPYAFH